MVAKLRAKEAEKVKGMLGKTDAAGHLNPTQVRIFKNLKTGLIRVMDVNEKLISMIEEKVFFIYQFIS